jgi:hypothetical protein
MKFNCYRCSKPDALHCDWDADINDPESYLCIECSVEDVTGKSWIDRILVKAANRLEAKKLLAELDDE